ncbi:RNA polymerase sigma factor [Pseudofulvibacter geojedonensis]|uniref:RNA polymerase sigma factor n=1 Tax=Pseudofulvibacter geojedonensis TaxID=1123758 RepID=A0ABW3I1K8_9FLAO
MQQQEIIQLVEGCKKQNQKAQLALYDMFYRAMYNTALRIVQDKMLAEDIMQEAFITVFAKIESLDEVITFPKWLKQIVVNKSLNFLKKEKRFTSLEMSSLKEEVDDGFWSVEETKDVKQIILAINDLKENYRVLLTLYYIEGYDYEEIVQITGFTHVNCRTLLSRAKKSLQKKMQPCLKAII